jgi:NAD(P)-dependent dehydrogenase (short-subunit alcohol dehydrogenase family)
MNILVLGASRGIGLELVRQYLAAGDRVTATAREEAGLAHLTALGAKAFELDVSNPASISGLSLQLEGEKIDLALYVAGVFAKDNALTPPTQDAFDAVMHTNVLGAMQALPQVAPMVEAAQGMFCFVTSEMGHISGVGNSNAWLYRTSKAALNMAVVAAQGDYPAARMVLMHPGWVQTDMGTAKAPLTPQTSVAGMRATLATLANKPTNRTPQDVPFLQWDGKAFAHW